MLLVVGLGNPGSDYAGNRHNIGYMAVDAIARHHNLGPFRAKFEGRLAEGRVAGRRILALKPETYMNESGRSVARAAGFFKIPTADIIIFHDEIDLESGRLRVKTGGGHAGHNGLRNIHAHLGDGYRRVRLGVGHPGDKGKVSGHVLNDFAKADREWLEPLLDALADAFPLLVEDNDGEFMNRVTLAVRPKPAKGEAPPGAAEGGGDGL